VLKGGSSGWPVGGWVGWLGGFGVRARRLSTLGAFVVCWLVGCCAIVVVAAGWLALLKIDKTNCRCRAVLLMSPEPENVLFVLCDFAVLFRSSVFIRFNLIFIDSV